MSVFEAISAKIKDDIPSTVAKIRHTVNDINLLLFIFFALIFRR